MTQTSDTPTGFVLITERSATENLRRAMRRRQRDGQARQLRMERAARREVQQWRRELESLVGRRADAAEFRHVLGTLDDRLASRFEADATPLARWSYRSAVDAHRGAMTLTMTKQLGQRQSEPLRKGTEAALGRPTGRLTRSQAAEVQRARLFPPLADARYDDMINASQWGDSKSPRRRFGDIGRRADFADAARRLSRWLREEPPNVALVRREIDRLVRLADRDSRSIVRTESGKVIERGQRASERRLGPGLEGRFLLSVGDDRVRPLHRHRHGRFYKRDGNRFVAVPPPKRLPEEPFILPKLPDAPNCRCFTVPVYKNSASL